MEKDTGAPVPSEEEAAEQDRFKAVLGRLSQTDLDGAFNVALRLTPEQLREFSRMALAQDIAREKVNQSVAALNAKREAAAASRASGLYPEDSATLQAGRRDKKTKAEEKETFTDRKAAHQALLTSLDALLGVVNEVAAQCQKSAVVFGPLKNACGNAFDEAAAVYQHLKKEKAFAEGVSESFHEQLTRRLLEWSFLDPAPLAEEVTQIVQSLHQETQAGEALLGREEHILPAELEPQEQKIATLLCAAQEKVLPLGSTISSLSDLSVVMPDQKFTAWLAEYQTLRNNLPGVQQRANECLNFAAPDPEGLRARKKREKEWFDATSVKKCEMAYQGLLSVVTSVIATSQSAGTAGRVQPAEAATLADPLSLLERKLPILVKRIEVFYPLLLKETDLFDKRVDRNETAGAMLEKVWPLLGKAVALFEKGRATLQQADRWDDVQSPLEAATQLASKICKGHEVLSKLQGHVSTPVGSSIRLGEAKAMPPPQSKQGPAAAVPEAQTVVTQGKQRAAATVPEAQTIITDIVAQQPDITVGSYAWRLVMRIATQCLSTQSDLREAPLPFAAAIHSATQQLVAYIPSGETVFNDLASPEHNPLALRLIDGQIEAIEGEVACLKAQLEHKMLYLTPELAAVEALLGLPEADSDRFHQAQTALHEALPKAAEKAFEEAEICLGKLRTRREEEEEWRKTSPEGQFIAASQALEDALQALRESLGRQSEDDDPDFRQVREQEELKTSPEALEQKLESVVECVEVLYPLLKKNNGLKEETVKDLSRSLAKADALFTEGAGNLAAFHRRKSPKQGWKGRVALENRIQPARDVYAAQEILTDMQEAIEAAVTAIGKTTTMSRKTGEEGQGESEKISAAAINLQGKCDGASTMLEKLAATFSPEKGSYIWQLASAISEEFSKLAAFAQHAARFSENPKNYGAGSPREEGAEKQ